MNEQDIINAIPEKYLLKLNQLGVLDVYVAEVQKYYPHLSLPKGTDFLEHYTEFANYEHANFAAFMWKSWYWNFGVKSFSWWFNTVFGYDFVHDPLRRTSQIVQDAINNYKEKSFENENVGPDYGDRSSKQLFYDAYGDGFSEYEDSKYWNNDDVEEY